jgi:hypothetical protein
MDVNMQSMIESLTDLVRTIGSDGQMQQWFWSLGRKSLEERRNAVYLMSMRIASVGKSSASLVTAFKLLAVPQVFEAACDALRKCGYPEPA